MDNIDGLTVLLTRAREDAAVWAEGLAARGARAVVFPCIEPQPIRDAATAAALTAALCGADWRVLSSVRGVHGVAEFAGSRSVADVSIATVGNATAAAADQELGRVDLVAADGTGRDLAEALAQRLVETQARQPIESTEQSRRGDDQAVRVVAAGAQGSRRDLDEVLEPLGIEVSRVAVYRTAVARGEGRRESIASMGVDAIFLASPSAVSGLLARARVPEGVGIITIGPSTTRAAREAGLRVDGEACRRDLEGMIEAIP